ncbi:MAG: response regulator [Elusimicrobia bacterium]|nr:response regulator [Elusimicrobiota bacterium]
MRETPVYVLLVEDSPEDAALAKMTLEAAGIRVTVAESVAQGRAALEQGSYEILVLDLRLPDGEGLDLLPLAQSKDPNAVGIVLTGFSNTEAAVAALRKGAYDFLTKPCAPEVLVAAVKRGAERHRLARQLAHRTDELEALNRELDRRVQDSTRQIFFLNERLKRFIVQIMQSNEERVKFLDNMTHELKNPLAVIFGHACHLLGRESADWTPAELAVSLKAIHRNSSAVNAMLEELMDVARLSSHKMRLVREPLHANDQAREIVESYRPQAHERGIELVSDCGDDRGMEFEADRIRLRQVLSNLVSNALKFTPAGGKITVGAVPSGSSVRVTISDTGPGIGKEAIDRVFDRFYQVNSGQQHKGLGLGLEISKGIVTLHGGTIWAESEPGKGAKFHFTIPCVPAEGAPDPEPVPPTTAKL